MSFQCPHIRFFSRSRSRSGMMVVFRSQQLILFIPSPSPLLCTQRNSHSPNNEFHPHPLSSRYRRSHRLSYSQTKSQSRERKRKGKSIFHLQFLYRIHHHQHSHFLATRYFIIIIIIRSRQEIYPTSTITDTYPFSDSFDFRSW